MPAATTLSDLTYKLTAPDAPIRGESLRFRRASRGGSWRVYAERSFWEAHHMHGSVASSTHRAPPMNTIVAPFAQLRLPQQLAG